MPSDSEPAAPPSGASRRGRVWLADDSAWELEHTRALLAAEYAVEAFSDGAGLLERLEAPQVELPDLLVLDWHMPGVSGLDACRFVRERHAHAALPVLVLTASTHAEDLEEAFAAGANDFVSKPARGLELLARVRTLYTLARHDALLRERAAFEQQLIGIVSHDLRNPLAAINMGAALLLRRSDLDERQHRTLLRIRTSAERANRMIRDLLDFTQARLGGRLPVNRVPGDVHAVVRQVMEESEVAHSGRALHYDEEGSGEGLWDADRLAQVVVNLLANALHYSPGDTPVRVSAGGDAKDVVLRVHNAGTPISPELLGRLFRPLQRGVEGMSQERSVGLGLYIVDQVVRAHGGRVEVSSTAEAGTTFTVRLPRA